MNMNLPFGMQNLSILVKNQYFVNNFNLEKNLYQHFKIFFSNESYKKSTHIFLTTQVTLYLGIWGFLQKNGINYTKKMKKMLYFLFKTPHVSYMVDS